MNASITDSLRASAEQEGRRDVPESFWSAMRMIEDSANEAEALLRRLANTVEGEDAAAPHIREVLGQVRAYFSDTGQDVNQPLNR